MTPYVEIPESIADTIRQPLKPTVLIEAGMRIWRDVNVTRALNSYMQNQCVTNIFQQDIRAGERFVNDCLEEIYGCLSASTFLDWQPTDGTVTTFRIL